MRKLPAVASCVLRAQLCPRDKEWYIQTHFTWAHLPKYHWSPWIMALGLLTVYNLQLQE